QLGGRRLDSCERKYDGAVWEEHDVSRGRPGARAVPPRDQVLGLGRTVVEEVAQRRPGLRGAEREACGLKTPTPGAREHAADRNGARRERRPDAPRVLAPRVG